MFFFFLKIDFPLLLYKKFVKQKIAKFYEVKSINSYNIELTIHSGLTKLNVQYF